MVESQKRTLKILCLHGFNTSAEVFQYQYRHFKQVYGDIMEFHVLDAPHECEDSPTKQLVEKGFKAPFRAWMNIGQWHIN